MRLVIAALLIFLSAAPLFAPNLPHCRRVRPTAFQRIRLLRVPIGDERTVSFAVQNRGKFSCVLAEVEVEPFDGRIDVIAPSVLEPKQRTVVYVTFIAEHGAAERYAVTLRWDPI